MTHKKSEPLDTDLLQKVFLHNLNRLYFAKCYLNAHLEQLTAMVSFPVLQLAMEEFADDVKNQIKRMDEIFKSLNEVPSEENYNPIKSIVKDKFCLDSEHTDPLFKDMDVIAYVHVLEHINMAAYSIMKTIALKLELKYITQLLTECFDESYDDDHLFALITKEYISAD